MIFVDIVMMVMMVFNREWVVTAARCVCDERFGRFEFLFLHLTFDASYGLKQKKLTKLRQNKYDLIGYS